MSKLRFAILLLILLPIFTFATDRIDLNSGSLEQLDELIGIGPVLAQRIIDARPFYSIDDLVIVKGIGPSTLEKIKLQGLAYVLPPANEQKLATAPLNNSKDSVSFEKKEINPVEKPASQPKPSAKNSQIIDLSSKKSKPPLLLAGIIIAVISSATFLYLKEKI